MNRSRTASATAARAVEAADALLDWLRTQPDASRLGPVAGDGALAAAEQHQGETTVTAGIAGDAAPVAPRPPAPAPTDGPDRDGTQAGPPATCPVGRFDQGAPLRLAHPDWLHHRLIIDGPAGDLADFRAAAAGAGIIPWQLDFARLEEDWFLRLVTPPPPQQRTLSVAGARILAGQLRDAVTRRHALAVAQIGRSRACPFDLHALLPVPDAVLQLGPDQPDSLAWLWRNWGTTEALRHVTEETTASRTQRRPPAAPAPALRLTFWSADWTPWRALAQLAARWPTLRFDARPRYDLS